MNWAEAGPNLLIGLREGLEAGLVVSILLAAVRKAAARGQRVTTVPVWLGVAAAIAAAGSVAAVLTFSTNELSGRAQEVVGGVLSVLAVGLVTAMIFWMRRTARRLSAQLRGEVVRAAAIGAGALTLTAFLAVAREGVETSLFLWTAVKASGSTLAPLVGAGVGLVAAVLVCWLLYRQAVRINLGKFFTRTAYALIVIAAGVLAYGLGDLQSAGWLPGRNWVAFDLTRRIDPSSWWISILTGVTELSPRMSVLQVVAWCSYLAVVIGVFAMAGRPASATSPAARTASSVAARTASSVAARTASSVAVQTAPSAATAALTAGPAEGPARPGSTTEPVAASGPPDSRGSVRTDSETAPNPGPNPSPSPNPTPRSNPDPSPNASPNRSVGTSWWERLTARRAWPVAGVLVAVPVIVAGLLIAVLPSADAATTTAVTITDKDCGKQWASGRTGTQTFRVANQSDKVGEINLVDGGGAVVAEIETIGPETTADMTAALGPGTYALVCMMAGTTTRSAPVTVSGNSGVTTTAVKPVTLDDLADPNKIYLRYAAGILNTLAGDVETLRRELAANDVPAARPDWLTAQLDWERVGASYNSFGDGGVAVDGLSDGLPKGADDPDFTGLHRLEYGLWSGQSAAELLPVVDQLAADVTTVRAKLATDDEAGDPTNLPLRAHEILEDALRDHLSGIDNNGADAAYAMTYANTEVTAVVLDTLAPLITVRAPTLLPSISRELSALQTALLATKVGAAWTPSARVPLPARQRVNAAIGAVLESLASVPDLLEVPPSHQ